MTTPCFFKYSYNQSLRAPLFFGILIGLLMAAAPTDAAPVPLSGRVTGYGGKGVSGATLHLRRNGMTVQSNTQGYFSFSGTIATTPHELSPRTCATVRFSLTRNGLILQSPNGVHHGTVRLFDLAGRQLLSTTLTNLAPGQHAVAVLPQTGAARQAVLVQARLDGQEQTLFLAGAGEMGALRQAPSSGATSIAATTQAAVAAIDTLDVEIHGISKLLVIDSYESLRLAVELEYVPVDIPALPPSSMTTQNRTKTYLKGRGAHLCGFVHEDNDVSKDVIGFVASTYSTATQGPMTDEDMKHLLDFPKLRMVFIQNQQISDSTIKLFARFPQMVEVRLHRLNHNKESKYRCSPDFLKQLKPLRNLRVLEIKHGFNMSTINMAHLDSLPYLKRLVLDNGAATGQGMAFARTCTNLRDLSWHRGTLKHADFVATIPALPKLQHLLCRDYSEPIPSNALEILSSSKTLESLWLVNNHEKALLANDDFLMPLVTVPTFTTLHNIDDTTSAAIKLIEARAALPALPRIQHLTAKGYINLGYIIPPYPDLDSAQSKKVKALLK